MVFKRHSFWKTHSVEPTGKLLMMPPVLTRTVAISFALFAVTGRLTTSARTSLVRRSHQVSNVKVWTLQGSTKHIKGDQIYDYMDGAGEIPLACSYQSLTVSEYSGRSGGTITHELYDMGNSADAFGLFSMKRLPAGRLVPLHTKSGSPILAQAGFHELLFHKGKYTELVFADESGKVKDDELLAFASEQANEIKEIGTPPELLRYLPKEGYIAGTAKYFHGKAAMDTIKFIRDDAFQFKTRPDAAVASYVGARAMVIRYGSSSKTAQVLGVVQRSPDTKSMIFTQQGNLLGVVWSLNGAQPGPSVMQRLKRVMANPGSALEGASH